ncbi:hypothetical protein ACQE98_01520 [Ornithinimicrobium sp. W1679]
MTENIRPGDRMAGVRFDETSNDVVTSTTPSRWPRCRDNRMGAMTEQPR